MTKSMTVRLDDDLAERLEEVALVDGIAQAEVLRLALTSHIERRCNDPGFRVLAASFARGLLARLGSA